MKITEHIKAISNQVNTHLSIPASYHIYNGNLALSNTVITAGMATTLYTGNGSTQSVVTGVDMASQWGNDASETFGGLVWCKSRSNALSNYFTDTIRGNTKVVSSDITNAEVTTTTYLTSFNNNGFSLGSGGLNANLATYASWVFQTTHRTSGVTNHGKAYTCHYNPFTGFTIVKYEGSGIAGHEIPHHLGRKLGFVTVKNLSVVSDWLAQREGATLSFNLNATTAEANGARISNFGESTTTISATDVMTNTSANQYILYGWANSYFDENSTLIGNYEIGTYVGTGAAGNKVTTRGKPAWVMVKSLSATGNWIISDNLRINASLYPNLANIEAIDGNFTYTNDGFTPNNGTALDRNTAGVTYLYMVVYDNDSGSGKSKYPKATDTSTLNLNAHVPFANGIDATGNKVSIAYKNETITLSNSLVQGKNYIALLSDGTYVAKSVKPSYGLTNPAIGDFFSLDTQKWYSNLDTQITPRNYLDCIVYADQNGQPEYVEQLPKTTYFDKVSIQNGFDLNQKWVDLKSSRFLNINYINTTGKPIIISVGFDATTAGSTFGSKVDGVTVSNVTISNNSGDSSLMIIVPPNSTYNMSQVYLTGGTITFWAELR